MNKPHPWIPPRSFISIRVKGYTEQFINNCVRATLGVPLLISVSTWLLPTPICPFLLALTSRPAFTAIATDDEAVLKPRTDLIGGEKVTVSVTEDWAFDESDGGADNAGVLISAKSRSWWIKPNVDVVAEKVSNYAACVQPILLVFLRDRLHLFDLSSAVYKVSELHFFNLLLTILRLSNTTTLLSTRTSRWSRSEVRLLSSQLHFVCLRKCSRSNVIWTFPLVWLRQF